MTLEKLVNNPYLIVIIRNDNKIISIAEECET